jgi:hypothetical protein
VEREELGIGRDQERQRTLAGGKIFSEEPRLALAIYLAAGEGGFPTCVKANLKDETDGRWQAKQANVRMTLVAVRLPRHIFVPCFRIEMGEDSRSRFEGRARRGGGEPRISAPKDRRRQPGYRLALEAAVTRGGWGEE